MIVRSALLALLLAALPAWADGRLYVWEDGAAPQHAVEDGQLVMRVAVEVVPVTHVVLRHDTDDRAILWLELHMEKWRDSGSGDHYFDAAFESDYQLHTRASEFHGEKGCKWALRFDDVATGRKVLAEVATDYGLGQEHALDRTGQ